jgi:hypothetical protein
MKLKFELKIPQAIWYPETIGDGYENELLDSMRDGYDFHMFYFEDYMNYTEIVSGDYILSGYENGEKIGDWLFNILVIGQYNQIKAVLGFYKAEIEIVGEVKTVGPDGLDMTMCIYKIINSPNAYNKKLK